MASNRTSSSPLDELDEGKTIATFRMKWNLNDDNDDIDLKESMKLYERDFLVE